MLNYLPEIIFLPALLVIGFFTSSQDIKRSRISNKAVGLGIIYAFCFYAILTLLNFFHGPYQGWPFFETLNKMFMRGSFFWSVNLLVSIVVAYALWHNDAWGAGDAKLFICYAALIPLIRYKKVYFHGYFASFQILYYTFLLAVGFILLTAFIRGIRSARKEGLQKISPAKIFSAGGLLSRRNIIATLGAAIGFFVILILIQVLRGWAQTSLHRWIANPDLMAIILLIFSRPIARVVTRNILYVLLILAALLILFWITYMDSPADYLNMTRLAFGRSILLAVIFPVARALANYSTKNDKQKIMPFAPWLFLGALAVWFAPV